MKPLIIFTLHTALVLILVGLISIHFGMEWAAIGMFAGLALAFKDRI